VKKTNRIRIRNGVLSPALVVALVLGCVSAAASDREVQLITQDGQNAILLEPGTDPIGAQKADVTVVEYFDYNCTYCKKMAPVLQGLIAVDDHVRILYKEWPILGDISVYAARAALASRWQHKYVIAHDALMAGPRLATTDQVDATLKKAGINLDMLANDRTKHLADIDALLARNDEEARALSLKGTPGIVVGRQLLPGIVDLGGLKQLVELARHVK